MAHRSEQQIVQAGNVRFGSLADSRPVKVMSAFPLKQTLAGQLSYFEQSRRLWCRWHR